MSSPIVVDGLVTLFLLVVRLSWQATIVAALVLGVQWVLGRRLPAVWRHALWAIVLVRLVIPAVPGSAASIFNVLPPWKLTHIAALPNPVRGADTRSQMERGELASIGEETDLPPAMVSPESSTLTTNRATVTAPLTVQTQPSMLLAISIAWLVGVVLLILRTLFTVLRLRRDISRLPRVTDSQVLQLFSVCCRRMRLRRTPELIVGPPGSEVGVTGVWRTSIILPEQVLTHLSTAETEHVLLHELVHVTRGDLIWNWAALGVCHMHWFNPVVWYARYRAKLDAELACDAQVLSLLPASETTSYGMTLLRLLEQASGMSGQPLTVRMIGGKRSLHRRMKMIASYRKTSLLNTALGLAVSLLLCVIGLTGVARSTLATEPPQKPAPEQKLTPKSKVASGDQSAPKSAHVPVPVPVPATLQTVDEATYTEMTLTFNGSPMAEAAAAKDVHFGPHIYISMAQAIRLSRQERPHRGVLINGINLTDFDLEQLRLIPETRDLAIYNTGIEGPGLSQIASLPNLEQLRLFGARCTDAYLAALPQIPKLRSLTIVGGVISPEGLSVLKKFPQLKSLKLAFVPVDDGLQYLREVPQLTFLVIENTDLSDVGIKHLQLVPKVSVLRMRTTKVTDEGLQVLRNFTQLRSFDFGASNVRGPGLAHLAALPKLESLSFNGRDTTDAWLQALEPLRGITFLQLSHTRITGAGLAPLRNWSNVKEVYLRSNHIDDEGIEILSDVNRISNLHFDEAKMTHVGRQKLRETRSAIR